MNHQNFRVTATKDGSRHFDRNAGYSSGVYQPVNNKNRGKRYDNRQFRAPANSWNGRSADQDDTMGGDDRQETGGSRKHYQQPYTRGGRFRGRGRGVDRRFQPGRLSDQMIARVGATHLVRSNSCGGDNSLSGGIDWFRVRVKTGKILGREFVIQQLTSLSNVRFTPYCIFVEGNDLLFYVKEFATSKAIEDTNRRATLPGSGAKMIVEVTRCINPPPIVMSPETIGKIKLVLSERYDTVAMSLDASSLCKNNDLINNGIYMMFARTAVGLKVVDIIGEHIPELKSLNLSNNAIVKLESFEKLAEKAPGLVSLNLSGNRLQNERDLVPIEKLGLLELQLDGNRIRDRFKTQQLYISAIRRIFPKIMKLDGMILPAPITFDLEAPTTLPVSKGSHFLSEHTKDLISRFIEQYFGLYDSAKRVDVGAAYHDAAKLSVCCFYSSSTAGKRSSLNDYQMHNRNLKGSSGLPSTLKCGRESIVSLLAELPATQHDPLSFVIDVNLEAATILTFTINGIFKEVSAKSKVVRQFSRTFVTVPNGPGLAIINELMTITHATSKVTAKSFNAPAVVPALINAVMPTSAGAISAAQIEMVKQFSMASTMNEEYSMRCLIENAWDYVKAAQVFTDANAKGGVPPQAFVR